MLDKHGVNFQSLAELRRMGQAKTRESLYAHGNNRAFAFFVVVCFLGGGWVCLFVCLFVCLRNKK